MPPPKNKKELQDFLGIINYLHTFSSSTASVYEPLQKLMLSRAIWTSNTSCEALYDKTKSLIENNICMKFDETKALYLETDASETGLHAALLQTRDGMKWPKDTVPDNTILRSIAFASKSLSCAGLRYSNIEREALGILHGFKKFHHYCFAREVSIITDKKPLVAMFK